MLLVETQYFTLPTMELECGEALAPLTIAYETYGALNASRDNAVLLCHALTGDAHAAGCYSAQDPKAGWYDRFIGPGKALDTDRYYVICSNIIGSCNGSTGPASVNPQTQRPYGLDFPVLTVKDMVQAQYQLLTGHFGLSTLRACVGGSLGGMQALEWGINYPGFVRGYLIMASAPYQSSQNIALHEVGRRAIMSDPHWLQGNYYGRPTPDNGLAIARMIAHISYLSDQTMHLKFGRRIKGKDKLAFELHNEFEVESYLEYQGRRFISRFDANSYLYITRAVDYFDYSGDKLVDSLQPSHSRYCIISFSSDWLYPPYQSEQMVQSLQTLNIPVTYYCMDSPYGHDAFLLEDSKLTPIMESFLANLS